MWKAVTSKAGWIVLCVASLVCALFLAKLLRPRPETGPEPRSENPSAFYQKRAKWDELSGGGANINISVFAFRDLNRNGEYDLEDGPLAGVAFELLGPDNKRDVQRSNINGFCNFQMSVDTKEGNYAYRALTPPGWKLTTHNEVQRTSFQIKPGSVGDMISTTPADPVGFAQSLTIAGRVDVPSTGTMKVVATSPSGTTVDVSLDKEGTFLMPAERGTWLIEAINPSGAIAKRAVNVDKAPVVLSQTTFGQPDLGVAPRTLTLGFDDLITPNSIVELPGGYGGLEWRNWVVTHKEAYGGPGYVNNTMSGEYVVYNSSGHPTKVFAEKQFDFLGGYFSIAWEDAEGETLRIEGWRGDELVYQDEIELSALGPVYFDANYANVTVVKFSTRHYWQFVGDDLTFGFRQ
jgi:hypothetical protein